MDALDSKGGKGMSHSWAKNSSRKPAKEQSEKTNPQSCGYKESQAYLSHCMQFAYAPAALSHKYDMTA